MAPSFVLWRKSLAHDFGKSSWLGGVWLEVLAANSRVLHVHRDNLEYSTMTLTFVRFVYRRVRGRVVPVSDFVLFCLASFVPGQD